MSSAEALIRRVADEDSDIFGIALSQLANGPAELIAGYADLLRHLRLRAARLAKPTEQRRSDDDILAEVSLQRRAWAAIEDEIVALVTQNPPERVESIDQSGRVSVKTLRGPRRLSIQHAARITGRNPATLRNLADNASTMRPTFAERLATLLTEETGRQEA